MIILIFALLIVGGETCGHREEYTDCGTACPLTCDNMDNPPPCALQCVPGCFCEPGRVRNSQGKCVAPYQCPAVQSDETEDEYCNQRRPSHCFTDEKENPVEIPESIEDLNKICPIVLRRIKCGVDYLKECETKRVHRESFEKGMESLYEVLVEVCDKESEIHRELTRSLPCISNIVNNYDNVCGPMVREARDELVKHIAVDLTEEGRVPTDEEMRKFYCFMEAVELSCVIAQTSVVCGEETKNVFESIVNRIGFLESSCDEDIVAEAKATTALFQLEMKKKIASEKGIED